MIIPLIWLFSEQNQVYRLFKDGPKKNSGKWEKNIDKKVEEIANNGVR